MFDLKRPCKNCPFLKSQGHLFRLGEERVRGIVDAPAFQCHKTLDFDADDGEGRAGDQPQQCAGLMALLHKEGRANQIMRVAERISNFDASKIDASGVYDSTEDAIAAHEEGRTFV